MRFPSRFLFAASFPAGAGKERARPNTEGRGIVKYLPQRTADRTRVNEMIRARQIRVIDEEGNQLGIMSPLDAMRDAEERGLDLVEVAPTASPPVCRIMDYGKYKYQQSKRTKESKKHQHVVSVKEVKYRPKIDGHDFDYKTNHAREFLSEGNKVKVTIMFRGREMAHPEFGREILARVVEATKDLCQDEVNTSIARLEGRNMSILLNPSKVKSSAPASTAPSTPKPPKPPKSEEAPKAEEAAASAPVAEEQPAAE